MTFRNANAAGETAPLVSPVFNVERFLADAIESILGQTFTDFECMKGMERSTAGRNPGMAGATILCCLRQTGAKPIAVAEGGVHRSNGSRLPGRLEKQVGLLRSKPDIAALVGTQGRVVESDLTPRFIML